MQVMNCLIVEDEPLAADVIKDYIKQVSGLKLCGICENVFSAMEKLRNESVQLIFLDINLPRVSGIEFIKTLQGKYDIVIITAYQEYALDGFNLNVIDYLLKPVEFSRFLQSVNKVFEKNRTLNQKAETTIDSRKHYFFNVDKRRVKVFFDEILYVESLKDYIRIHTHEKKLVTKLQLGEMDKLLEDSKFLRIHKSFIVNMDKISAFNANEIEVATMSLPIGRTYKEMVERQLMNFQKNS